MRGNYTLYVYIQAEIDINKVLPSHDYFISPAKASSDELEYLRGLGNSYLLLNPNAVLIRHNRSGRVVETLKEETR